MPFVALQPTKLTIAVQTFCQKYIIKAQQITFCRICYLFGVTARSGKRSAFERRKVPRPSLN